MKRIFPAVKLRLQTPLIDKREIGNAAIPGERRIYTSPSPPTPPHQLGSLANDHTVSSDVTLRRGTIWSGKFASLFPVSCEACSLYLVLCLCVPNRISFFQEWHFLRVYNIKGEYPTDTYVFLFGFCGYSLVKISLDIDSFNMKNH